ncbi:MAG TPA: DUF4290 domain-containing protein [Edaphocola sp.]|nr:DUF4290 domain-containing protein [Edaphocola sp.]
MEYNTERGKLIMPEYGRNIQKMVNHILTIEDKEKRQKNAEAVIELMGVLNPHLKIIDDFKHKLWDHIFRISDFKIEIESPYPTPTKEILDRKPEPLPYPKKNLKNRHIGHNLGKLIEDAIKCEDEEKKKAMTNSIAYYLKLSYANWHKEQVQDDHLIEEIKNLSKGALEFDPKEFKIQKHTGSFKKHNGNAGSSNKNKNNFKNKGYGSNFPGKNNKQQHNRPSNQKFS